MPIRLLLLLLAFATAAIGQTNPSTPTPTPSPLAPPPAAASKPAPSQDPAKSAPERSVRGNYDERTSRDLFTACDSDGNDRLDVFEAGSCLSMLRGAQDHDGFGRIDKDRDGYLSWPEFDQVLRRTLSSGLAFKVRPSRPLAPATPEPKVAGKMQQLLQLHDVNRNGGLDPAELEQYLLQSNLPVALASQLRLLDQDRSGRLEENEFAPWFERLGAMAGAGSAPGGELPAPWASADADHNSGLDSGELAQVLRRIDPALAVWAKTLLTSLDQDRDGVLRAAEIPGPLAEPAKPPAGQLPKSSTVR